MELTWVPSRHDQSTAIRISFDLVYDKFELIYAFSFVAFVEGCVRGIPISPLETIDRAEIPCFSIYANAVQILLGAVAIPNMNILSFKFFRVSRA